ncbi:PREDICTED: probable protein phosphatase 2C 33 isoform X2 [Camelina sativa]|uniref:Probable protein phosphatase 2C 33 isoform X1 n=1 Tax=Camelina sativa TaxID=90675 RepID=A0ABM1RD54_CAMSA|nr:PREDICTED: probable protein phosphatase 2C 33 isoform X2 [Camelina sativa]XP_010485603.1 PREDICTED: probable protein phosphatase 2C 33 isoform X2 [Camelina sativa]XP_019096942.1 PREDICTED: probable protein phosphatase 2C 33 isoform X1 [Camelina sativa]XP_019096943.1 PREDICTED: probable protein phosphatase 2C 33 isoform X2 [Camelina sativa]
MGSCLSAETRSPGPGSPCSPGFSVRKRKNSKKRPGSRNSSFDYRREEPLHHVPGRMFLNGSSDAACIFTQQGKKGPNQDAMVVWENFGSRTDTVFCGVFDGHGPYGHMVAKRVRDNLPLKLSTYWEAKVPVEGVLKAITTDTVNNATNINNSEDNTAAAASVSAEEEPRTSAKMEEEENMESHPELFQTLKESFLKAFKVMDRELKFHGSVDCFCSGTTAVTLIKQGQYLVVGNIGDSRAVMGTRDSNNALVSVQLTVDLKPNLPAEAERIRKCRGRVFALRDEPEVCRVWLPNCDSPGLAMARAFGDFCLKDFGLISVPDVSFRRLTKKDEFIVLATDGIWDVLSNDDVVGIVASAPSRSTAARAIVESAVRAWRYKYPTSKVDDCAAVCLYLDANNSNVISTSSSVSRLEDEEVDEELKAATENDDASGPSGLGRSSTVRTGKEIALDESEAEKLIKEEDNLDTEPGTEYSALEGVARVNTLLNLPRFVPGK